MHEEVHSHAHLIAVCAAVSQQVHGEGEGVLYMACIWPALPAKDGLVLAVIHPRQHCTCEGRQKGQAWL